MTPCEFFDTPDVELYFYEELGDGDRVRVEAHLRTCTACRQRLDDLHAIRHALAATPVVDAPPAGEWSGFMRRLDTAVVLDPPSRFALRRARRFAVLAATLAIVAIGVFMAARARTQRPSSVVAGNDTSPSTGGVGVRDLSPVAPDARAAGAKGETPEQALRDVSAEHLERSKLVVLGLATRDPHQTHAADWQFERQLAGSLLPDTRLYRLAAQERGVADVARVMRDLETVLLEASMTDGRDQASLARVQRLIARRGLVAKMHVVTTSASGL